MKTHKIGIGVIAEIGVNKGQLYEAKLKIVKSFLMSRNGTPAEEIQFSDSRGFIRIFLWMMVFFFLQIYIFHNALFICHVPNSIMSGYVWSTW